MPSTLVYRGTQVGRRPLTSPSATVRGLGDHEDRIRVPALAGRAALMPITQPPLRSASSRGQAGRVKGSPGRSDLGLTGASRHRSGRALPKNRSQTRREDYSLPLARIFDTLERAHVGHALRRQALNGAPPPAVAAIP
jgi:hypothetical protein